MTSLEQNGATQNVGRGFLARQLRRLRQYFSDMQARSALREQMAELDRRGGLDDVLNDIGVSRPAMARIIRGHPEAGRLLPAMAKRLGVDLEKLDPRWRYSIQRACGECPSHRRCRRWLATSLSDSTEYRDFCPNAELFEPALARTRQN